MAAPGPLFNNTAKVSVVITDYWEDQPKVDKESYPTQKAAIINKSKANSGTL